MCDYGGMDSNPVLGKTAEFEVALLYIYIFYIF